MKSSDNLFCSQNVFMGGVKDRKDVGIFYNYYNSIVSKNILNVL